MPKPAPPDRSEAPSVPAASLPAPRVAAAGAARAPSLDERGEGASLLEAFEANVRAHPHRTLFLTKADGRWKELTYGRFAEQVDAVRGGLHQLGVEAGERVAIIAKNSVAWAAVAYACYGLHAALVPMYEAQLERDWLHILRDSAARVVLVATDAIRRRLERARASLPALAHVIVLEPEHPAPSDEALNGEALRAKASSNLIQSFEALSFEALVRLGQARPWPPLCPAPGTPAAFLYTSGTTGEPKGVVLTHGNLWSNVRALKQVALGDEQPERHRTLAFLPWAHAFAHTVELHLVVAVGASLALAESLDKVADNLREVRPTVLIAVPRVFIRIHAGAQRLLASRPRLVRWLFGRGVALACQQAEGRALSGYERSLLRLADRLVFAPIRARFGGRLKFAISGAAPLPSDVASFVAALGITVCEGYGLTETSPIVSANVPGQSRVGSVGRPLPGVRVVIDPSAATALPRGDGAPPSGEIIVYGPNVMAGYHNREPETRQAFTPDGGFKTGDLGYLDADGFLYVTGRIKEHYKLTNGKYVAPAALEAALERSPFVAEAMVHGDGRPYNVALIVPSREALLAWARERGVTLTEAVCHDPRVRDLLQGEIDRVNAGHRGYERIRAFFLLARSFSEEEGLLTPSAKLRRHKVVERYRAEIDALYAHASPPPALPEHEERLI